MSTYYGCPECGYRVVSQETGKCPNCDEGVLGDVVDTTPWPEHQSSQARRPLRHYFRVTLNNNGKFLSFNVRAAGEQGARRRAIRVCQDYGWTILTLEGSRLDLSDRNEPEHSIDVVRLTEVPDEYY